eukprot:gene8834-9780_t
MVPRVITAAKQFKNKISFIAINCWLGTCKKNFPLNEFPKFFAYHTNYPPVEFLESPDSWRIVQFLQAVTRPFHYLGNEKYFNEIIASHQAVVVGYFNINAEKNRKLSTFLKLCIASVNRVSHTLYGVVTNSKMAAIAGLKKYGEIILHQILKNKMYFPDKSNYTAESIANWIIKNQVDVVKQLTPNMTYLDQYIHELKRGPSVLLFLSFRPQFRSYSNQLLRQYRTVATQYNNCTPVDFPATIKVQPPLKLNDLTDLSDHPNELSRNCKHPCNVCVCFELEFHGVGCSIFRTCTQSVCMHDSQLKSYANRAKKTGENWIIALSRIDGCRCLQRNTYYYPDVASVCCFKKVSSNAHADLEAKNSFVYEELYKKFQARKQLLDNEISNLVNLNKPQGSLKMILDSLDKLSKLDSKLVVLDDALHVEKLLQVKQEVYDAVKQPNLREFLSKRKQGELEDPIKKILQANRPEQAKNTEFGQFGFEDQSIQLEGLAENFRKHRNFTSSDFPGLRCKTNRTVEYYYVDVDTHNVMVKSLGIDRKFTRNSTLMALVDLKNEATYVLDENTTVTADTIVEFVSNFTNGRLEKRLKSADTINTCTDTCNKSCIHEVTTQSFQDIILDESKDVLLMYYAPWCGYCKQGYKVLLQLALVYTNIKTLRFARIDAEQNDLPYHYIVDAYPTFILFPRQRKSYSHSYPDNLPVTFRYMKRFLENFKTVFSLHILGPIYVMSAIDMKQGSLRKELTPKERQLLQEIRKRKQELLTEIQQLKDEIGEINKDLNFMDELDETSQPENTAKLWNIGKKKFNIDPGKGLEYLYKNCLINLSPEDVAAFLYKGENLNKVKIGEYLGEKEDFNIDVLKHFVALHDFKDKLLVDALRDFLWNFRLPGEAQKIDRMMESFAERYCNQNVTEFKIPDTCYVLSFSIIMLNTNLHNPSVKDKQTLDGFINMNRGINNGDDLSAELLTELYESIRDEPFKIPEDDGNDLTKTFFNAEREGMLTKEGGLHKSWKPRYFILKDNCLYYFKNRGDKEPRGIIPLENLRVRENQEIKRKFCFEIYAPNSGSVIKACKTDSDGKVVTGHHDIYRICASSAHERDNWITDIKNSITRDPFYEMLQARKKKATHLLQGP